MSQVTVAVLLAYILYISTFYFPHFSYSCLCTPTRREHFFASFLFFFCFMGSSIIAHYRHLRCGSELSILKLKKITAEHLSSSGIDSLILGQIKRLSSFTNSFPISPFNVSCSRAFVDNDGIPSNFLDVRCFPEFVVSHHCTLFLILYFVFHVTFPLPKIVKETTILGAQDLYSFIQTCHYYSVVHQEVKENDSLLTSSNRYKI